MNNLRNFLLYGTLVLSLFLLAYVVGIQQGGSAARESLRTAHINQPFTGQELFDAVNRTRERDNLEPFVLSEEMCDDLGTRYNTIRAIYDRTGELSHDGFSSWAEDRHPTQQVIELITTSPTLDGAISGLLSSPSHRLPMLNPTYHEACTFAEGNIGLILIKKEG